MKTDKEASYFSRYRGAARRFEIIGIVLILIGIALNLATGSSLSTLALLIAALGAFLLIIGGSSLRPHNLVKAFAQQCAREPCNEIAQGLLQALESDRKIRLMQKSIDSVTLAIEVYAALDDADPELVRKLREAKEQRLVKKAF